MSVDGRGGRWGRSTLALMVVGEEFIVGMWWCGVFVVSIVVVVVWLVVWRVL